MCYSNKDDRARIRPLSSAFVPRSYLVLRTHTNLRMACEDSSLVIDLLLIVELEFKGIERLQFNCVNHTVTETGNDGMIKNKLSKK